MPRRWSLSFVLLLCSASIFAQGNRGGSLQQGNQGWIGGSDDGRRTRTEERDEVLLWTARTAILTPGDRAEYTEKGEALFPEAETYVLKALSHKQAAGGKFILRPRTFPTVDRGVLRPVLHPRSKGALPGMGPGSGKRSAVQDRDGGDPDNRRRMKAVPRFVLVTTLTMIAGRGPNASIGSLHDPQGLRSRPLPNLSQRRGVAKTPRAGLIGTLSHPPGTPPPPPASRLRRPYGRVFLRAFKHERELELWAANGKETLRLVRVYPIAAMSGTLGPKRREGDLQVPEGFYTINRFNPQSHYHLSMGIDYPNASDRLRGREPLGEDIFVHGKAVSAGCLAMTDPLIDEIYPACRTAGNRASIPVHIFPARLDGAMLARLRKNDPRNGSFWTELKPIYDAFERTRVVPRVRIERSGAYFLAR